LIAVSEYKIKKPRYALIADQLSRRIQTGRYKVGAPFPSEAELCAEFGVSHHTVRSAMGVLKELRLVTTEQGRGSRVVSNALRNRYVHIHDSIPEFGEKARDTSIVVLKRRLIDATEAADARLPTFTKWHDLEALRYIKKNEPLVWKRIYIAEEFAAAAAAIGRSSAPIYTLIEKYHHEKVQRVQQEIYACPISGHVAKLLRVKSGAAGLVIERRYAGALDRVMEVTKSIYPSDKFRYSSDLQLEA
jgi:GntR family transcriptional regulator